MRAALRRRSDLDATVDLDVGGDEPAAAELSDAYHRGDTRDSALPAGIVLAENQTEVDQVADLGLAIGREQHAGLTDVPCHTLSALEFHGKVEDRKSTRLNSSHLGISYA